MTMITEHLQVMIIITIHIAIRKIIKTNSTICIIDDTYMNIRYSADCTHILAELDNYLETPICNNGGSSSESTQPPFETSDEGEDNFLALADILASTGASEKCDTDVSNHDDETESPVYLQKKFPTLSNLDEIECSESNVESSQGNWVGTNDTPSDEQASGNPENNPENEDSENSSDKTKEESIYQSQRILIYHPNPSTDDEDEPCRLKRSDGFYAKSRTAYRGRLSGYGLQRWKFNKSVGNMSRESVSNF
ncbi:protein E31B [Elephant endotheliotropic herpesvirus 6]|nr:protein E31B [Elephant endotheliotropic herpesvirus 6]